MSNHVHTPIRRELVMVLSSGSAVSQLEGTCTNYSANVRDLRLLELLEFSVAGIVNPQNLSHLELDLTQNQGVFINNHSNDPSLIDRYVLPCAAPGVNSLHVEYDTPRLIYASEHGNNFNTFKLRISNSEGATFTKAVLKFRLVFEDRSGFDIKSPMHGYLV